jgi:D-3-phosphoglycerate dehydrogenase / 2-oxoglutarate reductase
MKILVADKLSASALQSLESLGGILTISPDLKADDLPQHIANHEILVVRSTKVNAATITAATALALVIRAGAGVNTIDLSAASKRGIYVANCPGENTQAVVELAIGLLIAADRRIVDATHQLRDGKWNKKEFGKSYGLAGRTLGIVGLGAIGKAIAKAAQGLGMNVIAWSRSFTPEMEVELGIGYCESPLELAKKSDAVSINLASSAETRHLCNEAFFSRMRDGAIFINTSRGDVVDTVALKNAIESKNIRVGLDVFENEPAGGKTEFAQSELAQLAACTPHIGASTDQASEAIASAVVRIVKVYADTGKPINAVNIRKEPVESGVLVVTHDNKVGVLASVLKEIRNDGINIEEMENKIFSDGSAGCATLKIDRHPSADVASRIREKEHIIRVQIK